MGLGLLGSAKRCCGSGQPALQPGDPDPKRYKILSAEHLGPFMLLEIEYPDATSYGGRKLALYEAAPYQLLQATRLDPHFTEPTGPTVPIARFEPTERGRAIARKVAVRLQGCPVWGY